ncbi:permease [Thermobispora bispora]|uniref:sulfite exporter TauE/SafE family protein n=1 Tax=Thermobispora bispora TaxID=2006 RepID=UPI0002E3063D|nr:sulfite exporter TauE/SafE family protein [Thermobispora bispora]MDI9580103.1 sulfite exporter TauE/SafE family protein [Thermobispora sp.]
MGQDIVPLLLCGLAVFAGAVVQGGVGFGLGIVCSPIIAMLLPGTVPGAVQVVNASLPVLTLAAEWRRVDWRGVGYALIGRLPGSLLGGLVVVYVSTRTLGLLVAVMVMVAVVLTARSVAVPRTGGTLTAAGFLSGVTGTATGIGGPPIALVYQNAQGAQIRATLAMFFLLSTLQSLVILAVVGKLPPDVLGTGLALVPFVFLGFLASRPLRRRLQGRRVRIAVLSVATLAACALLVQSLV